MAAAYRVAAPSIRFVPWAALASCWPLPQQLLPVSATGGGRRCCTLRIFSGKIIFNRAMPERLRTLRHGIFTGRGRNGKRQLPRLLPAEAAALRESFCWLNSLSQNLTVLPAPSEREPLARPRTLRLSSKHPHYTEYFSDELYGLAPPLGELARERLRGRVFPQTLFLHISPAFRPNY